MARKIKIEPAILRRYVRQKSKRQLNTKKKRKRYLIVCEGEKTEPNYFESLRATLPRGVLDVVDFRILGEGFNTETLVKRALEIKKEWEAETSIAVDKLWVVFDKDSFTAASFNKAIQTCENSLETESVWTNEAFELWYLLHFEYYNTGIIRETYKKRIQNNFRMKGLDGFIYEKNRTDMFLLLSNYGDRNLAIKRAKRLHESYGGAKDFANQNPCSTVYKLVVELLDLEELLNEEENTE